MVQKQLTETSGVMARIKAVASNNKSIYIHHHILTVLFHFLMSVLFKNVLDGAIKIIDFIKS